MTPSTEIPAAAVVAPTRISAARRILGSLWLRALVTVGLLGVVAASVDWSLMGRRVADGDPWFFVVAVLLVVAALAVGAYRWWQLLRAVDVDLDGASLARVYAMSTFGSTFLPTSMGGDVARAFLVVRSGPLLGRVGLSIVVDRVGGLVGLLGVAWLALALDREAAPYDVRLYLLWVTIAFAAGGLVLAWIVLRAQRVRRLVPDRLRSFAAHARSVFRSYAANRPLLVSLVFTSLVFQALVALSVVALAESIGIDLSYPTAAVTITLMTVATLFPLSVAGFGVREASYIVVLAPAGVSTTDAALISLLTVAALFVASLPGAYLLVRRGAAPVLEARS